MQNRFSHDLHLRPSPPARACRFALLLALVPLANVSFVSLSAPSAFAFERAALELARQSITSDELYGHVSVLADDTFEGREAGSRGGHAAGNYLAQYFEKAGLKPAGDEGSYFQSFGRGYRNLLGLLEGSDPQLKDEIIVVGGHYDHVGYGNRRNSYGPIGYIHNGADDNASGVAGVLEVLDAVTRLPSNPRRSILFAFWDGEEKGLVGSKHWVASPTLPLDQVTFAINVDMIGRLTDERVQVYGVRTGYGLRQLIGRQNCCGLKLAPTWQLKSNSDHHSFYSHGIPVLMLHTGLHDDYHRPSDDAHLVNVEGLQQVARLMFHILVALAEQDRRVPFRSDASQETEASRQTFEAPGVTSPPRLGVTWTSDATGAAEGRSGGLTVAQVTAGGAADRAGIAAGDKVVVFEGEPIVDRERFQVQLHATRSPVKLGVLRQGQQQPTTLVVELDGKPARIGISWHPDPANPGTVLISSVTPGSAAELAGLEVTDRIYEVNGQTYSSSDELLEILTSSPAPLRLLIEREGQLREAVLEVLSAAAE